MILLIVGVGALLTAANIAIILLRPPQQAHPVMAFELARLLNGESVAKFLPGVTVQRSSAIPDIPAAEDNVVTKAVRRTLRPGTELLLEPGVFPRRLHNVERIIDREYKMYGDNPNFTPFLFGNFKAAAKQPDGSWIKVVKVGQETGAAWQIHTALLLAMVLLATLPVAWMFSKRFERPIRDLATAIDRLGQRQDIDPLPLEGPDEIRAAAAAVNQLETRLKRFVAERTSLVGAVAHDLRTPLARMKFHLHGLDAAQRKKCEQEIAEMEKIIDASLQFAEHESRMHRSERIDLQALIESVVDDLADLGRDVTLKNAVGGIVLADPVLLRRALLNLINNALDYGQRAEVELALSDSQAVISISDSGPGMSPADLERAFEPFFRAENSRNRATGGIGLGLAIVSSAVEASGGSVALENRSQGGLCATLKLPLQKQNGSSTP
jgi:signal transduction histidine kinase